MVSSAAHATTTSGPRPWAGPTTRKSAPTTRTTPAWRRPEKVPTDTGVAASRRSAATPASEVSSSAWRRNQRSRERARAASSTRASAAHRSSLDANPAPPASINPGASRESGRRRGVSTGQTYPGPPQAG